MSGGVVEAVALLQGAHLVCERAAAGHDDDGKVAVGEDAQPALEIAGMGQAAAELDDPEVAPRRIR
jgi:hypothetical protein